MLRHARALMMNQSKIAPRISFIIIAALFMVVPTLSVFPSRVDAFAGGDGSEESPYQIADCVQLQSMIDDRDAHYEIVSNIDCSDTVNWNDGAGYEAPGTCWGGEFSGTINGNGHKISNLYINRPTTDHQGLVGCTANGTVIENLGMSNVDITGQRYAGAIAGALSGADSSISNVYATGNISLINGETMGSGQYTGGITSGIMGGSHIEKVYSTVYLDAYYADFGWAEGALVGFAYDGSTVGNSFWDQETVGTNGSAGGGTARSTTVMKTQSNYTNAGWDFDNIWAINPNINSGYPYLRGSTGAAGSQTIFPNNDEDKAVLIEQESGTEICDLFDAGTYVRQEEQLDTQDPAYDYVSSLVGFTLRDCEVGGTTIMRLVFTGDFDPDLTTVRKYNEDTGEYTTVEPLTMVTTTLSGQPALEVTYEITDGGVLDQDGVANGTIVDPVGLAVVASGTQNSGSGSFSGVGAPNTGLQRYWLLDIK